MEWKSVSAGFEVRTASDYEGYYLPTCVVEHYCTSSLTFRNVGELLQNYKANIQKICSVHVARTQGDSGVKIIKMK
jgi:hypothetical protein